MRKNRLAVRRDDRGAVLIIVAVFAIVAVIMLAAVIDLGGLRQEKRELTLSTDAAALAGVQAANFAGVTSTKDCAQVQTTLEARLQAPLQLFVDDVVRDYLANNGGSTYISCQVVPDGAGSGYVAVRASDSVEYAFGKAMGQSSGTVSGSSAAAYTLDLGGGLRPVGVCELTNSLDLPTPLDLGDELAAIVGDPITDTVRFSITLPVERLDDANDCGSAEGHFGQIDFEDDGNAQGNCNPASPQSLIDNTYCEYLYNGWFGDLADVYSGDTGNNYNSPETMFTYIRDVVGHFFIPVYIDVPNCTGPPASRPAACGSVTGTPFEISYYAEVSLDSFCLDGNANAPCRIQKEVNGNPGIQNDEKFRWLKFDVYGALATPLTKLPKTFDAEEIPPRICAVDEDLSYCG